MSRILITGVICQLGAALKRTLGHCSNHQLRLPDSGTLDVSSFEQVSRCIGEFNPAFVIDAATYTAVDRAESEPDQAHAVNTEGRTKFLVSLLENDRSRGETLHWTDVDIASWYDFAWAIRELATERWPEQSWGHVKLIYTAFYLTNINVRARIGARRWP